MKELKFRGYLLKDIVKIASTESPYYKKLYGSDHFEKLDQLPIVNMYDFWNSIAITNTTEDRIVFKSGGSTGVPKHSHFTHNEWELFVENFGKGIGQGIIASGDRVGNLFYAGDLYASFMFISDSLKKHALNGGQIWQFPITGQIDNAQILKIVEEFNITVLAGVPTSIISVYEYGIRSDKYKILANISKILFGGEAMFIDQANFFKNINPNLQIASIGCASVDGGPIGFYSNDCLHGEHRCFDGANIVEIVDTDTDEVILDKNKPGKIIITNLCRKLMPIIRFPSGDMGEWVEDHGQPFRKFKLLGRSDESARVGTTTIHFEETRLLVKNIFDASQLFTFQMMVEHFEKKDKLTLIVLVDDNFKNNYYKEIIISKLCEAKPMLQMMIEKSFLHSLVIEFRDLDGFAKNNRTGKIKRIIDLRI